MTYRAQRFLEANKQSPVVYGSVISHEHGGCFYRLQDNKTFELNADECRSIGHPRWLHLEAA